MPNVIIRHQLIINFSKSDKYEDKLYKEKVKNRLIWTYKSDYMAINLELLKFYLETY